LIKAVFASSAALARLASASSAAWALATSVSIAAVFACSAADALAASPEIAEPKFTSACSKFYCKVSIFPCKEVN
jgi:hypothetical protein